MTVSGITTQNAALLILQSTQQANIQSDQEKVEPDLVAVANGAKVSSQTQPDPSASKISDTIFSVNHVDAQSMKLDLYRKTGEALGVDQDDFEDIGEYADALRQAVGKLKIEGKSLRPIEKELGLDKLGISLEDLIDSMTQPNSDVTKKLETALAREAGLAEEDDTAKALTVISSDIGIYQVQKG